MRHLSRALLLVALAATALTALPAAPASGRTTADDISIVICLSRDDVCLPGTKTGPNFQVAVQVKSRSSVLQTITVRIGLPAGLRWGSDAPDPSEDCTGTAPAVCIGGPASGWFWDVVAERFGFYEVTATAEAAQPDPDLSNNSFTFRFEVVSSPPPPPAALVASAVRLSPGKPKAGSAVSATVRVTAGGAPVRPSGIACTAAIGSAKFRGAAKAASGTATCVYRPPKTAKGKLLRGTISFTARGTRFTRRFSSRLG